MSDLAREDADQLPCSYLCREIVQRVAVSGLVVALSIGSLSAEDGRSPLRRLKDRSARERWQQVRDRYAPPTENGSVVSPSADGEPAQAVPLEEMWKTPIAESTPVSNSPPENGTQGSIPTEAPEPAFSKTDVDWEPVDSPASPEPLKSGPEFLLPRTADSRNSGVLELAPSVPLSAGPTTEPQRVIPVPEPYLSEGEPSSPLSSAKKLETTEEPKGDSALISPPPTLSSPAPFPILAENESPSARPAPVIVVPAPSPDPTGVPPEPDLMTGTAQLPSRPEPPIDDPIFKPISDIQPFESYRPASDQLPGKEKPTVSIDEPNFVPLPSTGSFERPYAHVEYHWAASNLHHNPLYFEDVSLERYGHTYPDVVQPFVSVGKFGLQVVGLPYTMMLDKPKSCVYALGYYRPGQCAPYLTYQVPLNLKAAAAAGGIYTGLFFIFP
ncbi:MAG: hypothetical protein KDA80_05345 [Planctomycetaceae bacterium]|nr:hypothetical protein [Planctomycetaceae bacterium]